MTTEQRDALKNVVHYLSDSEASDYRASSAARRRAHIYASVLVLEGLLAEHGERS